MYRFLLGICALSPEIGLFMQGEPQHPCDDVMTSDKPTRERADVLTLYSYQK